MQFPNDPAAILRRLDFRPSRKLGQNFLRDESMARDFVDACIPAVAERVVEIGPGLGALTAILAGRTQVLWALEKDRRLAGYLREQLADKPHVTVIEGDATEFDFQEAFGGDLPFLVIGNLPYSAATEILFHLLKFRGRVPLMGLMVQEEVGQRLQAAPGSKNYGRLSILPQIYYEMENIRTLSGDGFLPVPDVHSRFVVFRRRTQPLVDFSDARFQATFERLIAAAFMYRRKTLRNMLKAMGRNEPAAAIQKAGFAGSERAENFSIAQFVQLAQALIEPG